MENKTLEGRILFLLIMTIAVQFLYPLSIGDSFFVQFTYPLFYASLFFAAFYMVRTNRTQSYIMVGLSVTWIVLNFLFVTRPDLQWVNLMAYLIIILFHATLISILLKFIFQAKRVNTDVLLAACTVYILLGALFVAIYGIIETLTWFPEQQTHAFIDGVMGATSTPFPWQTLSYYSYATLTTLGYGDVLPATHWARSAATLQAVIGVLYTAVIVSRLVGLYAAKEVEDDIHEREERNA